MTRSKLKPTSSSSTNHPSSDPQARPPRTLSFCPTADEPDFSWSLILDVWFNGRMMPNNVLSYDLDEQTITFYPLDDNGLVQPDPKDPSRHILVTSRGHVEVYRNDIR